MASTLAVSPAAELADFLYVLSTQRDPEAATNSGVARVAETIGCDLAAVIDEDGELVCAGLPADDVPQLALRQIVASGAQAWALPPFGDCAVACAPLDRKGRGWLLAIRAAGEFGPEERELLAGMGKTLGSARKMLERVQEAVHRASHDALTKLPNRENFGDRLAQALDDAEQLGQTLAVLFLDLDKFKQVNDSFGHVAGDELLVAAAKRVRGCVRSVDTVGHFGGDEFMVLVENADELVARSIAERILRTFDQPFEIGGHTVWLSASIGFALAAGPEDQPIREADLAMYRAKTDGSIQLSRRSGTDRAAPAAALSAAYEPASEMARGPAGARDGGVRR